MQQHLYTVHVMSAHTSFAGSWGTAPPTALYSLARSPLTALPSSALARAHCRAQTRAHSRANAGTFARKHRCVGVARRCSCSRDHSISRRLTVLGRHQVQYRLILPASRAVLRLLWRHGGGGGARADCRRAAVGPSAAAARLHVRC